MPSSSVAKSRRRRKYAGAPTRSKAEMPFSKSARRSSADADGPQSGLRELATAFAAQMFDGAPGLRACVAPHIMSRPARSAAAGLIFEARKGEAIMRVENVAGPVPETLLHAGVRRDFGPDGHSP